jgi:hypothetical protein
MADGIFVSRQEKASWGIPCNQSSSGRLWIGKGYVLTLDGQFGVDIAKDVADALRKRRGDRNGRFWLNLASRQLTMAVGESAANQYAKDSF